MKVIKNYRFAGLTVPHIVTEPCQRVDQFMRGQPVTCQCSRCQRDNAGMTPEQIAARMAAKYA